MAKSKFDPSTFDAAMLPTYSVALSFGEKSLVVMAAAIDGEEIAMTGIGEELTRERIVQFRDWLDVMGANNPPRTKDCIALAERLDKVLRGKATGEAAPPVPKGSLF